MNKHQLDNFMMPNGNRICKQTVFLLSYIAVVLCETETLLTKPDSGSWLWTDYGNKRSGNLIAGWNPPSPVKKRYSVCDVSAKIKPVNWLRSDVIDVKDAKRLDVEVEYRLRCPTANCVTTFELFVYHADKNSPTPDPTQVSFDKVADLGPPSPPGETSPPYASNATLVTRRAGVYLAFLDSGACFLITKVTVSYYYCAPHGGVLVTFPRTAAPANSSLLVEEAGECTDVHSVNKAKLSAACLSNGEWNVTDNIKCLCKAGYMLVNGSGNTQKCEECPRGSYKKIADNSKCHQCPNQSTPNPDQTSCNCDDGFYKQDDVIMECKGLPTAPRQPNKTVDGTSVVIRWDRSTDDHGQLRYSVDCFKCRDEKDKSCREPCSGRIKYSPRKMDINGVTVRVSGLLPSSFYLFRVYSVNELNQLEKDRDKWNYDEVYAKTEADNSKCHQCPNQSTPNPDRTSCNCDDGFYKQDDVIMECKGLPTAPRQPNKTVDGTSVVIRWDRSTDDHGQLRYSVDCFKCRDEKDKSCREPCSGRIKYSPRKMDINGVTVRVSGLLPSSFYLFRVYSVNELNQLEKDRDKWNYDEVYAKTEEGPVGPTDDKKGPTISKNLIIICVLAGLLAILIASIGSYIIYKRELNRRRMIMEIGGERTQNREASVVVYEEIPLVPIEEGNNVHFNRGLELLRHEIEVTKLIGNGNFGQIFKAVYTGSTVAVKSLKVNALPKDKQVMLTELEVMKMLQPHPHVVTLIGFCKETVLEPLLIVLEYLPYGDLLGYLRKSRGHEDNYNTGEKRPTSKLTEKDLLSFAWMIADGMNYLSTMKIVHRDLAARNVLVGENKICKISDFGLARSLDEDVYTRKSQARLPAKWMPPESLFHGESSTMSDVWSYGIVMWEVFTIGDSPYPGVTVRTVASLLDKGFRMSKPKHISNELYSIMWECWAEKPRERPSFAWICTAVKRLLEDAQMYVNLEAYEDRDYVNFDMIEGDE